VTLVFQILFCVVKIDWVFSFGFEVVVVGFFFFAVGLVPGNIAYVRGLLSYVTTITELTN